MPRIRQAAPLESDRFISLAMEEPVVEAVFDGVEFVVSALFNDTALVEDNDPVAVADRAEPVRDDETGTAASAKTVVHLQFGHRVQGAGGFIENQHRGVVDERTRAISRRKRCPPLKLRPPSSTSASYPIGRAMISS